MHKGQRTAVGEKDSFVKGIHDLTSPTAGVPELGVSRTLCKSDASVEQANASVEQANASVEQANASVEQASASVEQANAPVEQTGASGKSNTGGIEGMAGPGTHRVRPGVVTLRVGSPGLGRSAGAVE